MPNASSFDRYSHLTDSHFDDAVRKFNWEMGNSCDGNKPNQLVTSQRISAHSVQCHAINQSRFVEHLYIVRSTTIIADQIVDPERRENSFISIGLVEITVTPRRAVAFRPCWCRKRTESTPQWVPTLEIIRYRRVPRPAAVVIRSRRSSVRPSVRLSRRSGHSVLVARCTVETSERLAGAKDGAPRGVPRCSNRCDENIIAVLGCVDHSRNLSVKPKVTITTIARTSSIADR
jgi:hypothetical protein